MLMTTNQVAELCDTYAERVRTAFKTIEGSKYKPKKQLVWNPERKRFFGEDVWSEEAVEWCQNWILRKEKEKEKMLEAARIRQQLIEQKKAERLAQLKKEKPWITDERCFDIDWWPDTYIDFGDEE